jgi:hypothetical protein
MRPECDADARLTQRELCAAPRRRLELAPDPVGDGLFAAFTGKTGKLTVQRGRGALQARANE